MKRNPQMSTFSIVAFDPKTKELGVAVQSKFLAVGSVVPFVEAGLGAIATQSWANPFYGPDGLRLLKEGKSPQEVVTILTSADEKAATRQLGIVDALGRSASFTGSECEGWAGGIAEENFAVQGNILASQETITSMAKAFKRKEGPLADRLVEALQEGQKAGGDRRGQQSAALLIYKEKAGYGGMDKYIDLRVDDHPEPINKLAELLELFYLFFTERDVEDIPLKDATLKEVQELLTKTNYYQGPIDSNYNPDFAKALHNFYCTENFEERIPAEQFIPEDILAFLRKIAQDK